MLDVTLGFIHLRVAWGVQNTSTSGVYDLNDIHQHQLTVFTTLLTVVTMKKLAFES